MPPTESEPAAALTPGHAPPLTGCSTRVHRAEGTAEWPAEMPGRGTACAEVGGGSTNHLNETAPGEGERRTAERESTQLRSVRTARSPWGFESWDKGRLFEEAHCGCRAVDGTAGRSLSVPSARKRESPKSSPVRMAVGQPHLTGWGTDHPERRGHRTGGQREDQCREPHWAELSRLTGRWLARGRELPGKVAQTQVRRGLPSQAPGSPTDTRPGPAGAQGLGGKAAKSAVTSE